MPENAPVRQVAYESDQLRRVFLLYLLKSSLYIVGCQRRRPGDKQIRLDVLIPPEVSTVFISILLSNHFKLGVVLMS